MEKEIIEMYWNGYKRKDICAKFNLELHTLKRILNRNKIGKKYNNYRNKETNTRESLEILQNGTIVRKNDGSPIKTHKDKDGYLVMTLYTKSKGSRPYRVHRFIAEELIPNPANKPHVNHIDGNKSNNSLDNLEWCTAKENEFHSRNILGKNISGHKKPNSTGVLNHRSKPVIDLYTNKVYGSKREFCIKNGFNQSDFFRKFPMVRFKEITKDEYYEMRIDRD